MATVYLDSPGVVLRRRGGSFELCRDGKVIDRVPLIDVDTVVVTTWAKITTPLVMELLERGIAIHYIRPGGRYLGGTAPGHLKGYRFRSSQYALLQDPQKQLDLTTGIVVGKIHGQNQILKRAFYRGKDRENLLLRAGAALRNLERQGATATGMDQLRGIEGQAAALYFGCWPLLLRPPWSFRGRNRRPPKDPVNALLSFGYTLLANIVQNTILSIGLDPLVGYLHPPFRNRSALVLDLMEEFRPAVVDRAVIALCNRGDLQEGWFTVSPEGVVMLPPARRRLIGAFEDRLGVATTDRRTGKTSSLRLHIEGQVRRWAAALLEDTPYQPLEAG